MQWSSQVGNGYGEWLFGNAGRDHLNGGRGRGRDVGNGGAGSDRCVELEVRRSCP